MSGTHWSPEERETLAQIFPASNWRILSTAFPERTRDAIRQEARSLGIERLANRKIAWTHEEDQILIKVWPEMEPVALMAAFPNRTFSAISKRATYLKVRRGNPFARRNKRSVHPILAELRRVRMLRGIYRTHLAERAGYLPGNINNWELGKGRPRFQCVVDWANALGFELCLVEKTRSVSEKQLDDTVIPWPTRNRLMGGR